MESKIKIKLGPIEVEYEGSEAFLKKELPALIKTVTELSKTVEINPNTEDGLSDKNKFKAGKIQLSTTSIAAKLPCSKDYELVIAAAAHLTLAKGIETFSRKQLLDDMKSASGYYKASHRDNLSAYLTKLIKNDKLNEPTEGHYSLNANTRKELEAKFAK
jgi:phage host-nuclease inhibitor protein Gam